MEKNKKKMPVWLIVVIVIGVIGIIGVIFSEEENERNSSNNRNEQNDNGKEADEPRVEIIVIDFRDMGKDDIRTWCSENNITCNINSAYSNNVENGKFVSQSIEDGKVIHEGDSINVVFSQGREPTLSQRNAVRSAEQYLRTMAFSRTGLIKQLEFEQFSTADATYAVDNIRVDWYEQAYKKGRQYLDTMAFSRGSLIRQLEFEGFTRSQATHAVDKIGL